MTGGPGWRARDSRLMRRGRRWLGRRAAGRPGSLVLGCARRYAEATGNSAAALVLGAFLSVVPALLACYALADLSAGAGNGIAQHLVYRLHIGPPAAGLVSSAFGSEASNAAAASVLGLLGFLVFGHSLGKIVQEVYARAWRIQVACATDRWRFGLWFVVSTILLGLQVTEESAVTRLGWVLVSPAGFAVLVGYWLWTPWLLLHGRVALRRLLPGALLVAVAYMAAVTGSEFVLGYWITDNGRFFGSFGVVLALLAWAQVVAVIWLGCAVFAPVYEQWRDGWARTGASPFRYPAAGREDRDGGAGLEKQDGNGGEVPMADDSDRTDAPGGEPGGSDVLGREEGNTDVLGQEEGNTDVLGQEEGNTDVLGQEEGNTDVLGREEGNTDVLG